MKRSPSSAPPSRITDQASFEAAGAIRREAKADEKAVLEVFKFTALTMGPLAMEGDLKVGPGDIPMAGYDVTMPGSHPSATVFCGGGGRVVFQAQCSSRAGGGTITVSIADESYTIPQNNIIWRASRRPPQYWCSLPRGTGLPTRLQPRAGRLALAVLE